MSTDYNALKDQVDAMLRERGVAFSARYVGETKRDDWQCDAWRVTFSRPATVQEAPKQARNVTLETDYFAGLGHRKAPSGPKPYPPYRPGTLAHEGYLRTFKPQAPRAADVLQSLFLDGQAADMSFNDWCADYGYSADSIKALTTYQHCCDTGREMRRIFDRETQAALQAITEQL